MKIKASQFMGRREGKTVGEVPTLVVSKRAASTASTRPATRDTFYNVSSLEEVVSTFDENERYLRTASTKHAK